MGGAAQNISRADIMKFLWMMRCLYCDDEASEAREVEGRKKDEESELKEKVRWLSRSGLVASPAASGSSGAERKNSGQRNWEWGMGNGADV